MPYRCSVPCCSDFEVRCCTGIFVLDDKHWKKGGEKREYAKGHNLQELRKKRKAPTRRASRAKSVGNKTSKKRSPPESIEAFSEEPELREVGSTRNVKRQKQAVGMPILLRVKLRNIKEVLKGKPLAAGIAWRITSRATTGSQIRQQLLG